MRERKKKRETGIRERDQGEECRGGDRIVTKKGGKKCRGEKCRGERDGIGKEEGEKDNEKAVNSIPLINPSLSHLTLDHQ